MKKKYRFHTYVIAMASLCLLLACLGCNSGTTSTKEGSISFELEREDTLQTSSVQAKTKASPRWLQFIKSFFLPDTATAELDCDGISAIEAFVYDSSGELLNSGGPWDCILRHGSIDNIPEGINYSVVITAQNEVGLDLYRGEKKEISVEDGKNTDAGVITMERVYLYPLEISFEPDDVEPVWDESQGRWRYDFNYIVENPNNVPVEIIAFGQFNECFGTPDECSYTPDQFEAWMTGCNEVTTSIPAHGSACDNEWSVNGYAANGDVTGQYAVWYRDDQDEPQVALSAPLTLRQPPALSVYYRDGDGDGYGNPESSTEAPSPPSGYVTDNTDCNDTEASINPGATEIRGNDIDENCDGIVDPALNTYYQDADSDGYGNPDSSTEAPSPPSGYVTDNTDCNDTEASINPGATEIRGNDIDENCDGIVAPALNTYYQDADGDGYGNPASTIEAAAPPSDYVTDNTDCNDTEASINPGATEIRGNDIDENCDGIVAPALTGDSITNTLDMTFVQIYPGTFIMGSPEDELGRSSSETQHQVTLTQGYYMQTTEVTQGQWEAVMGSNPSNFSDCGDDCPVEQVSWDDVQVFITQLNLRGEGTYSLPTEAQWEYAARAGSTTALANGNITVTNCSYDVNLDAMGWYCYNSNSTPHPVAGKQANDWGLYDMHGNVWEWCQDWYYYSYPSGAVTNPEGPSTGSDRVFRGGSWSLNARYCRSALRDCSTPGGRDYGLGFRLVLSPGQ